MLVWRRLRLIEFGCTLAILLVAGAAAKEPSGTSAGESKNKPGRPVFDAHDLKELAEGVKFSGVQRYKPKSGRAHQLNAVFVITKRDKAAFTAEYWVDDKGAKHGRRGLEIEGEFRLNKLGGKATRFLGGAGIQHFGGGKVLDVVFRGIVKDGGKRITLEAQHPDGAVRTFDGSLAD